MEVNATALGTQYSIKISTKDGSNFDFKVVANNEREAHAKLREYMLEVANILNGD